MRVWHPFPCSLSSVSSHRQCKDVLREEYFWILRSLSCQTVRTTETSAISTTEILNVHLYVKVNPRVFAFILAT